MSDVERLRGKWSRYALPCHPDDVRPTGIDLGPAMLEIARARATELGREVDLLEGGVPDERAVMAEMYQVAGRAGRVS
jgi:hypothetical protein